MNAVILELLADHRRMVQVLRQIRRLVDITRSPGPLPRAALGDCFRYLADFPARVHHPREEVIFELLVSRNGDASAMIGSLHREHQSLDRSNGQILELLDAGDCREGDTSRIVPLVNDTIDRQIRHMRTEEDKVFPLVEKVLQIADWKAVMRDRAFTRADAILSSRLALDTGLAIRAIPGGGPVPAATR